MTNMRTDLLDLSTGPARAKLDPFIDFFITDPQLVVDARRVLLHEGTVVGGDVAVVRVFLQHVDFRFDFLFLVLPEKHQNKTIEHSTGRWRYKCNREGGVGEGESLTPVTSMTLIAASWPVLTWRPWRNREGKRTQDVFNNNNNIYSFFKQCASALWCSNLIWSHPKRINRRNRCRKSCKVYKSQKCLDISGRLTGTCRQPRGLFDETGRRETAMARRHLGYCVRLLIIYSVRNTLITARYRPDVFGRGNTERCSGLLALALPWHSSIFPRILIQNEHELQSQQKTNRKHGKRLPWRYIT